MKTFFSCIIFCLVFLSCLLGQQAEQSTEIGIVEKLGDNVPVDLTFQDETGKEVTIKEVLQKPTILALVYFRCPGICTPLLNGLRQVLDKVALEAGKDFQILTVSFNPEETSAMAAEKKKNYLSQLKRKIPESSWRFLVGKEENVKKLTDSVGFYYQKEGREYKHAATLTILSPSGKITRYLYGVGFLPFDLKMALMEASEGKVGPTIAKFLEFCYSYDPKGKRYGLNVIRISGAAVVIFLSIFILYLSFGGKKQLKKQEKGS